MVNKSHTTIVILGLFLALSSASSIYGPTGGIIGGSVPNLVDSVVKVPTYFQQGDLSTVVQCVLGSKLIIYNIIFTIDLNLHFKSF